jgi:hypothetical protein
MSTQEEARKAAAQQRQDQKHLQQSMRSRSEEALEMDRHAAVAEEARERLVEEHQHEKHIQKTMLNRTESELGITHGEEDAHQ